MALPKLHRSAQVRATMPLRPVAPKPVYTKMQITSFANSLEVSVDNSSFAKQATGPSAPAFERNWVADATRAVRVITH